MPNYFYNKQNSLDNVKLIAILLKQYKKTVANHSESGIMTTLWMDHWFGSLS